MLTVALVSSFPVNDQISPEAQQKARERLAVVPGEVLPAMSDEHVIQAVQYLAKHPEQIPQHTRMYFLRDLIAQDYNTAITLLSADFQELQERNPAEAYACRMVVDAWLIANGLRAIKWDEKVSSTIKAGREIRQKGLFRRWIEEKFLTDGEKQTALIHEALDLAGKNEMLRRENYELAARNQSIGTQAEVVLDKAHREAKEIIATARADAERQERKVEQKIERLQRELARLEAAKQTVLTERPELAVALIGPSDDADTFTATMASITHRLSTVGASCPNINMLQKHLAFILSIIERITNLAFEFDDLERVRILSQDIAIPEIRIQVGRVTVQHSSRTVADVVGRGHFSKFITAIGGVHFTRDELLAPWKNLLDDCAQLKEGDHMNYDGVHQGTVQESEIIAISEKLYKHLNVLAMRAASS